MKNLPHQKPIKFVEKIIELNGDFAIVSCSFPNIPTLAMVCEAAAQSSIAFAKDKEPKIGFLVTLKDIELLKKSDSLVFLIKIKKENSFDLLSEFNFELINQNSIYAKGSFIVKLQD